MADQPNDPALEVPASRNWKHHLWVFVVPAAGVFIAYALWFGLMALLRLPDWLARVLR
jgi:hypothetical protein